MSEGFHDLRISLGTSPLLERILTEGRTASPALPSVVTFGQIIITTDGRSAHVGLQLASRLTVDLRSIPSVGYVLWSKTNLLRVLGSQEPLHQSVIEDDGENS